MKAAVYYGPGDIRIREIEKPEANPEGVVVKVKACGVCNIMDAQSWEKWQSNGVGVGFARGHEWSGELVEVGSKVLGFKVGDRVYQNPIFRPCYNCTYCRVGDYWRCVNWLKGLSDRALNGAFAEYVWIPFMTRESAVICPEDVSFRDLSMVEPLYLSVGLAKKARPEHCVLVLGQELIGLGTVAMLKEYKVAKVIAADISQLRLKAAKDIGADVVIDSQNQDVAQVVMKETAGDGADVVIVNDSRPICVSQAVDSVRRGGAIWMATNVDVPLVDASQAWLGSTQWIGPGTSYTQAPVMYDPLLFSMQSAWGSLGPRLPRWEEAIKVLLQTKKITAAKHITQVYPLEKTAEAFEMAMNPHKSIKVIVEM
jgi:threonine dehydrogenase-like Zn-dependent dehydrogenase